MESMYSTDRPSAGKIATTAILITVAVLVVVGLLMKLSYDSQEARLRTSVAAQQKNSQATFDTMWQVISGKAQVADRYRESFRSIYGEIMDARYGGKSQSPALLSFIQEHSPEFDPGIFRDISNSIDAHRQEFLLQQRSLIDLKREHDNLRTAPPASFFEGGKPELQITVVTSRSTQETFKTGTEADRPIFEKK